MTWETIKPIVYQALAGVLALALGIGGTLGAQKLTAEVPAAKLAPPPAADTAPLVTIKKTEVVCVTPDAAGKMLERVTGVESVGTLILEQLMIKRAEDEKRERLAAARAAAAKKAAESKGILGF